jgi:hypothetical protein
VKQERKQEGLQESKEDRRTYIKNERESKIGKEE